MKDSEYKDKNTTIVGKNSASITISVESGHLIVQIN